MALITCPECSKQISENAVSCPNCGYPIVKEASSTHEPQQVEITSINLSPHNSHKIRKIIFGIFIFAFIFACTFAYIAFQNAQKATKVRNSYIDNLNLISVALLNGANDAEEICNLAANVWYNTIYEKIEIETMKYTFTPKEQFISDFNTSLANLFADEEIKKKVKNIELNRIIVSTTMKDLRNPSLEFEKCFETLNDLFSVYMGLTDLAIKPNGSLQTFSQNKSDKADKFMGYYRKFSTQIPEKNEENKTYEEFLKILGIK